MRLAISSFAVDENVAARGYTLPLIKSFHFNFLVTKILFKKSCRKKGNNKTLLILRIKNLSFTHLIASQLKIHYEI